jgi:hypothetical protein
MEKDRCPHWRVRRILSYDLAWIDEEEYYECEECEQRLLLKEDNIITKVKWPDRIAWLLIALVVGFAFGQVL